MRGLVLAAIAGCGSRSTVADSPPSARRDVTAAYHLGALRVEGAPPIDRGIDVTRFDFRGARLLDLDQWVLASADGDCVELRSTVEAPVSRRCGRDVEWAGYGPRGLVATLADIDGDERSVLHVIDGETTTAVSPPGRASDPIWDHHDRHHDRERLFYGFVPDGGDAIELWMTELGKPARRIAAGGPWAPLDVSRDGRSVLARREVATAESALYRIDVATGAAVAMTGVGAVASPRGRFLANGDLVVITDHGGERLGLELVTANQRRRLAEGVAGDVVDFVIAGDAIVFVTEDAGVSTLWTLELATGAYAATAHSSGGVITDLRAGRGGMIAFTFASATGPRSVHGYRRDPTGLSRILDWPGGASPKLVTPIAAEVVAADGVRSELLAYVPAAPGKHPVVVELHGGPEDRWRPRFASFTQLLVARGHAVIRPNVRGSAGQGRAFAALDDGPRRADVLRDVAAVLDWIATRPELDASRVVVMGHSYGGFVALSALLAFPARLRGGVTLGAITDLVGFLEGTAAYRREHRRAEYGDERDPAMRAMLAKLSPLARAAELRRPVLAVHGARDPRVPIATAERFIQTARAAGARVWWVRAGDEGHWFTGADSRATIDALIVQFLEAGM